MELYKDAYFGKSFMMIGDSLPHCFNCSYCRANDNNTYHFHKLPTELNPLFNSIPVAVNLFYGDPMLQVNNTLSTLDRLEEAGHKGPVLIVTKGNLKRFPKNKRYSLDLHFGLSTFGCNSVYDGGSLEMFESNLAYAQELGYKYSIEFRPIIKDINSHPVIINNIKELAKKYNTGIAYSGLQVSDDLKKRLEKENINFEPFDNHQFGLKKYVGKDVQNVFNNNEDETYPIFKKTSCLITWIHNLNRDPNAHYYRPNEVGCSHCPMKERCMKYKQELPDTLNIEIPFDYKIVDKADHICSLYKSGSCKFPSYDCMHIKGKLIKIDEPLTTTDVRLIKWLTGFTVDAIFTESPYISEKWVVNN